jgi:hypothetical protein
MKTLAQQYLEMGMPTPAVMAGRYRSIAMTCHNVIREALQPPDLVKLAKVKNVESFLQWKAERFAYIQDPVAIMGMLVEQKAIAPKTIRETARLPASVSWIEWPITDPDSPKVGWDRYGVLAIPGTMDFDETRGFGLDKEYKVSVGPDVSVIESKSRVFLILVASLHDDAGKLEYVCPYGILSFGSIDAVAKRTERPLVHWFIDADKAEDRAQQAASVWLDYLDALFLINTPRVSEIREHKASDKLQRARSRAGKLPMIEYRQVNIVVGRGNPIYARSRTATVPTRMPGESEDAFETRRRRLHRVIPHFRTYKREDGTARLVIPIEEQWRGDPALGIVLHDRTIRPPADKLVKK